jgi:hypothetical protein
MSFQINWAMYMFKGKKTAQGIAQKFILYFMWLDDVDDLDDVCTE